MYSTSGGVEAGARRPLPNARALMEMAQVVQPAQDFGVGPEVETREVEEGEQIAVADVEEEVRGAGIVAVLDQLGEREAEQVLVEADGPLDVAADQRRVVQAAGRAMAGRSAAGRRCCSRICPRRASICARSRAVSAGTSFTCLPRSGSPGETVPRRRPGVKRAEGGRRRACRSASSRRRGGSSLAARQGRRSSPGRTESR